MAAVEATRLPPITGEQSTTDADCSQLQGIYNGKFTDRSPFLTPAGKLTAAGDSAVQCLKPAARPTSPDTIRRFRATFAPDAGKRRVFYGKALDPHLQWAERMTHGVNTQPSDTAGDMVNPPLKPLFKQHQIDKIESGLYKSKQTGPLGKSHNQAVGFPKGYPWKDLTYGVVTVKDGSAGELVSPPKPYTQVQEEGADGHDMYVFSHKDYDPGEQVTRKYPTGHYSNKTQFGHPTPHDNAGSMTYKSLKWVHELQTEKAAKVINKRLDDWREKYQDQLGQTRDPIKETMNVGPDHTFGILVKPDQYGAGDLLHGRGAGKYLRGRDHQRGVVAALRQKLMKANYQNFDNLLAAFRFYDKENKGRISLEDLNTACWQYSLPSEPELLAQVMEYCDVDKDGFIDYMEFANFLNYNMPSGVTEAEIVEDNDGTQRVQSSREATPGRLQKQLDAIVGGHRTSSAVINGGGGLSSRGWRKYGVPTIRHDLPAPRFKSISDHTNYGDEATSHALVNPSIYSNRGVYEQDFLLPRTREQIRDVFSNVGVQMTLQEFDDIYDEAAKRHPKGNVSVEAFRGILDEIRAAEVSETEHLLKSNLDC
ncbi:EF-hand domain-containing family member B-like [Watersipora subatra]|uniref:EF-hand domain-containing family member B-like n=1 Tax=Watersipora subatra TaxID=2589382 RepID=UPI00355C1483